MFTKAQNTGYWFENFQKLEALAQIQFEPMLLRPKCAKRTLQPYWFKFSNRTPCSYSLFNVKPVTGAFWRNLNTVHGKQMYVLLLIHLPHCKNADKAAFSQTLPPPTDTIHLDNLLQALITSFRHIFLPLAYIQKRLYNLSHLQNSSVLSHKQFRK